jgi:predicted 3-demethylubiquinone-9 3-methyltransferase (glyoxalase superfamily)
MLKIIPCLWFDGNAEEAVRFYVSLFKNSKINAVTRYGEAGPGTAGSVMTIAFRLRGQKFLALNGGPNFKFTPAVSFIVECKTQRELDSFWKRLSKGGTEIQCGWLTDKFGLSWQVVPKALPKLLKDKDSEKTQRVMRAMFGMKKLDIKELKTAYQGGDAARPASH